MQNADMEKSMGKKEGEKTMELERELGYPPGSLRLVGYIDWYEIRDRTRLEAALDGLDGVSLAEEGRWTWHEGAGDDRRLLAELFIEGDAGDDLVIETTSEKDADRCRSRLMTATVGAVEPTFAEVRHEQVPTRERA